ncbi:hypothetical protein GX51_02392 [Blastomyces parvus]|uniref:Uncharacterized protein n=1 Tax=Blastomyces parvus TaxID=2060905 RepID=A0A2B7XC83_9EURO|nr:hypothetical protein GX51_02392 [Blastomyces parvus]
MPHKVDSYPSSTSSARDGKNVKVQNAQGRPQCFLLSPVQTPGRSPTLSKRKRDSNPRPLHHSLTKGFNLRRTSTKGPHLQKSSGGSGTQPRKPHLRREEAFRLGRRPMEIDTGGDNDGCAIWRQEAKRIEALFNSTKAKADETQAHYTTTHSGGSW